MIWRGNNKKNIGNLLEYQVLSDEVNVVIIIFLDLGCTGNRWSSDWKNTRKNKLRPGFTGGSVRLSRFCSTYGDSYAILADDHYFKASYE